MKNIRRKKLLRAKQLLSHGYLLKNLLLFEQFFIDNQFDFLYDNNLRKKIHNSIHDSIEIVLKSVNKYVDKLYKTNPSLFNVDNMFNPSFKQYNFYKIKQIIRGMKNENY